MIFISIIVLLIRTVCWMIIRERNIVNKMLIFMKWDNKEASRIFFFFLQFLSRSCVRNRNKSTLE